MHDFLFKIRALFGFWDIISRKDYFFKKMLGSGLLYYQRPQKYSENLLAIIDKFRLPVLMGLLAKSGKWRAEVREEVQLNLLNKTLAKAARAPFWKSRFEKTGFSSR